MITVDTSELRALAADFAAAAAKTPAAAAAELRKEVAEAEQSMRDRAPVLTGELRGSIGTTWRGPLSAEIGATAPYAGYVEGGTSDTAPQPFMGPTADQVEGSDAFDDLLGDLL